MKKPKPRKPRRPRPPTRPTIRYSRALRRLFSQLDDIMREALFDGRVAALTANVRAARGLKTDAPDDDLDALFEQIVVRYEREQDDDIVRAIAERYALETDEHSMVEHRATWRSALGIDVGGQAPHGPEIVRQYVRDNTKLIKTVQRKRIDEVQQLVERHWRVGDRWETIAPEIEHRFGLSSGEANRIARDQVQKLNGELSRDRQIAEGITHFRWIDSNDGRVRSKHREINRRVYTWADGHPTERFPGWPIHCRCYAEPVFPEDSPTPITADPVDPVAENERVWSPPPAPRIAPLAATPKRAPAASGPTAVKAIAEAVKHALRASSELSRGEISGDMGRGVLRSMETTIEAVEEGGDETIEVETGLNQLRAAVRRLRQALAKLST